MAKYTISRPSLPSAPAGNSFTGNCICPECRQPILAGQMIREQAIYKCGELDYVSIGHAECCPEYDNAEIPESDFDFDSSTYEIECASCDSAVPSLGCRDCGGTGKVIV